MAKWIEFEDVTAGLPTTGKTRAWRVRPKGGAGSLGTILWYGPWRRYSFFPLEETVLEATCLRDIAAFCDEQMQIRKGKKP